MQQHGGMVGGGFDISVLPIKRHMVDGGAATCDAMFHLPHLPSLLLF